MIFIPLLRSVSRGTSTEMIPRADLLYRNALRPNATNFSNENEKRDSYRPTGLGGTCFYVSAETLSLKYPFPNTPKSGANVHAASAASGAAGDASSEKFNELVTEKGRSYTRKFLKKLCCTKTEVLCQRR